MNYDQRMIRICNSLSENGYGITLIGVEFKKSPPLISKIFEQKRIKCFFKKGIGFYIEYNIKLFFKLLNLKSDVICCIDLDTIIPVYFSGKIKKAKLIYDAHEYFSEMKEVITRKSVHYFWKKIEMFFVPKFKSGYTVSYKIAEEFKIKYNVDYEVIMNVPYLDKSDNFHFETNKKLIYQGAVNQGRGLEYLIPSMKSIDMVLDIYGDGNFMKQTQNLIKANHLQNKVFLKGKLNPGDLKKITSEYFMGINLVENVGLNQYYSLANKFFDYIHAEIPQITMNYPEYSRINSEFEIALCIDDLKIETIYNAINELINENIEYKKLKLNCSKAKLVLNWQNESLKLLSFYNKIIG